VPTIHPSAIVSPDAELDESVEIGPMCVIEGRVRLAEGVRLHSHVVLRGPVEIGARTELFPFVCLGMPPQDIKFGLGDVTAGVVVGHDTLLREHVTIHASTSPDTPTRVGSFVFMMGSTHAAHDATIDDHVVLVNGAGIAGHGHVGEGATFGGGAVMHQHVRVGRLAFISGGSAFSADCPPFCVISGRNVLVGINVVGMRRAGMARAEISAVRRVFRELLRRNVPRETLLAELDAGADDHPALAEIASFVRATTRGICPGDARPPAGFRAWLRAFGRDGLAPTDPEDSAPLLR